MKTFKRPMFRRGGSTNEGVMNGMVDRENFAVKGIDDATMEKIRARENLFRSITAPRGSDSLSNLLISGGLNLISGEGAGDGELAGIARAFKKPTQQFFKEDAAEKQFGRQLGLAAATGVLGQKDKMELAKAKPRTVNSYESRVQGYMDAFKISRAEAIKRVNKDLETSPEQAPGTKEINFLEIYKRHPYRDIIASIKSRTDKKFVVIPAEAYDKEKKLKPDFIGAPGTPYYDPSTNTYFEFKTTIDPVTKKQTVTKVQIAEADLQ